MGYYVNPADGRSKEEWLEVEAVEHADLADALIGIGPNRMLVVLMDNGLFTAAGVAYCPSEVAAFTDPTDPRAKRWFVASVEKLTGVVLGLDEELKRRTR